jgi:hypothetical protein
MTFREGDHEVSLWNEQDGMYYDAIEFGPGHSMQLPVRSLVGLIPLYATLVLEPSTINRFPGFKKRMEWFIDNRPEVAGRNMANMKGVLLLLCFAQLSNEWVDSWRKGTAKAARPRQQGTSRLHSREDAGRRRILE